MNSKQKIKYVKDAVLEKAAISPSGPFWIRLYSVTEYEDGPTILSRAEQWSILQKLKQEHFLQIAQLDEKDKNIAWVELAPKEPLEKTPKRVSNLYSHIKTVDGLIIHRELFERFRGLLGEAREMQAGHAYIYPTSETNDDLIQLLIDLNIVSYDWEKLKAQTHREVGNRTIEFEYKADTVLPILARVSGKGGILRKEALELISREIGERFTMSKMIEVFVDLGVPETMFVPDTKWRAAFYALSFYATSKDEHLRLLKILEGILHPLMFGGDETKAHETQEKYRLWLKYDRIHIDEHGKFFLGPSEEEIEYGMDEWVASDGKTVEPSAYLIYPEHLAELCVLWTQVMMLTGGYQNRTGADHRELEKLYLDLLGKVETLVEFGKIGDLAQKYKRPFSSLATAEIETAQNGGIGETLNAFLKEINALQPDPQQMQKQIEKHGELLAHVVHATRLIIGDRANFGDVSYDQAIFLLKLVVGNIFKILDAVASGPLNMADEDLNEKYVLLADALQKLLERPDLKEVREQLPDIPEHLLEGLNEMDVWWEYSGPRIMGFYGDVEKRWILSGRRIFPVIGDLGLLFDEVDARVNEHNRVKNTKWDRMLKNADGLRERSGFGFPTPTAKSEPDTDMLEVKLSDGGILTLNKATGSTRLNATTTQLNPESQEYNLLAKLMTSKNYKVAYKDILTDNSKSTRRNLTFVVRNLKTGLGILPKGKAQNKNIIRNIKSHGYQLIT